MGGSDAKEGRVEICRDNVWGTVCSDTWTKENTLVVCKQLGLQGKLEGIEKGFSCSVLSCSLYGQTTEIKHFSVDYRTDIQLLVVWFFSQHR